MVTAVSIISAVTATVITYSTVMYTLSDEIETSVKKKDCQDSIKTVMLNKITKEEKEFKPFIDVQPVYPNQIPRSYNYSDDEIRDLREKQSFKEDGSYIYTPMRSIPSREKQIDKQVRKYIDEHGDQLYEELEDKYGN